MEVIKLSRIKSANHRQWISIDFGFDVADVEVGHFLIDDVIAAGGLWGDAISDVIGDVTGADLLAGPGRQFGRRPDGHLSDQSDVTGDVIAELLHAGQPLAAQVDVGGRDVTLDLLAIVQTFTYRKYFLDLFEKITHIPHLHNHVSADLHILILAVARHCRFGRDIWGGGGAINVTRLICIFMNNYEL